jgi:Tfp pilus assembly protein PilP
MQYLFILVLLAVGAHAAPAKDMKNFFRDKTKIDNPFSLRDPFKAPLSKSESKKNKGGFYVSGKGQYSNIAETPLDQLSVNDLKVVGVLIGRERRALVTDGKDKTKVMILKEGMKVGPESAELKAILPGGIVLVEKIVNVYGEEEYLETVIPISR